MVSTKIVFEKVEKLISSGKVDKAIAYLSQEVKRIADKGRGDPYIQRSLFLVKQDPESKLYNIKGALTHIRGMVEKNDPWSICQMARIMMTPSLTEHFNPIEAEDMLRAVQGKMDEAKFLLGHLHSSGMQTHEGEPVYDYKEASSQLMLILNKGEGPWFLKSAMKIAEISIKSPRDVELDNFEIAAHLRPFVKVNEEARRLYSGLLISELEDVAFLAKERSNVESMIFGKLKDIFVEGS